jgi:hypothetical protein
MLKSFNHNITFKIQRHLISTQEILQLATDFDLMHIDYMVLKGAPLNKLLYGNQLVRVSRDIDILIQIDDIHSVHDYLSARGYQLQSPFTNAHLIYASTSLVNYLEEILYWHPLKNIYLDLKWYVSTVNYFGMSWCNIKNHSVINMNAHSIKILRAEENFYYLCMHAAKHNWEYWQWLEDLASFNQSVPFCWDTVISLAKKTYAIRPLLEASKLLQKKFQIQLKEIPHSFWDNTIVNLRLYFIGSKRFDWLKNNPVSKRYFFATLGMFLYPKIAQKYHYIKRLLVLRVTSIDKISRFKNPKMKIATCERRIAPDFKIPINTDL